MSLHTREPYRSANGDRGTLIRDSASCRVFVGHAANVPSGGQITDLEIEDFLSQGGDGPEKQELLRLIGSLTEG